jgi:hypothetical protein
MENSSRPHLFGLLAGLFLAAGLVFAAFIVVGAWTRISESQVISVNGSARKNVRSDLVIWRASFTVDDEGLLGAHEKFKADYARVETFLREHGAADFTVSPLHIREMIVRSREEDEEPTERRVGYRLTQRIEVRSPDVEKLPRLGTESAALLQQGVALVSEGFEFIYTKAGDAKIEMMAEATGDARARAEQIALQGGRKIAGLRTARMGVVQINPLYSGATSWEGNNDTTSLEKTITATVAATFSLK